MRWNVEPGIETIYNVISARNAINEGPIKVNVFVSFRKYLLGFRRFLCFVEDSFKTFI